MDGRLRPKKNRPISGPKKRLFFVVFSLLDYTELQAIREKPLRPLYFVASRQLSLRKKKNRQNPPKWIMMESLTNQSKSHNWEALL